MGGFTLANACRAAGFAAAAYRTPPRIERQRIGTCDITTFEGDVSAGDATPLVASRCSCFQLDNSCRRLAFIDDSQFGTQAEVWSTAENTVLSFRGTDVDNFSDLVTDIYFSQRQLGCEGIACLPEGSLVHSGFGRAYASARSAIVAVLQRAGVLASSGDSTLRAGSAPSLLLTGHSLGGALALLAARELGAALGPHLTIYTFGAPRVGDTRLAWETLRATAECDGPYRVVNYDDYLVPRFPRGTPANRIWDYVHAGATVVLPPADGGRDGVPAAVHIAPVGDALGCPLKEVNPQYRGFVPPWAFEWLRTNLPAFAAQEVRTVIRLLTRGGVSAHYMTSYDEALCRCMVTGAALQVHDQVEELSAHQDEAGRPLSTRVLEEPGGYLALLAATWGSPDPDSS